MGVQEYWLFDPKGEWIEQKLKGYRLVKEVYEEIINNRSEVLGLRLEVESELIAFHREDTGEKLLAPSELAQALKQSEEKSRTVEKEVKGIGCRSRYNLDYHPAVENRIYTNEVHLSRTFGERGL